MFNYFHHIKHYIGQFFFVTRAKRNTKSYVAFNAECKNLFLEGYNKIGNLTFLADSRLGLGTYVGSQDYLPKCKIGRFSSLGNGITIIIGNHPAHNFVSTNPIFYDTCNEMPLGRSKTPFSEFSKAFGDFNIVVGNDVWIGNNVQIKQGITIGDGAIIGFGSIVTKDVLPYEIVAGNPAKIIRKRFEDSEIESLLRIRWWDWPIEMIIQRREDFSDVAVFIRKFAPDPKK